MNKLSKILSLSLLLCLMIMTMNFQNVKAQQPDYAKWGQMAIGEIKKKYADSEVTEYEYLGRTTVSNSKSRDTFDFVVKKNTEKNIVRVYVFFNPQTNQLINIQTKLIQQ
ncbi:DUF3889 domain-containing protein [Neobacillus mesonae]|uniref:DUF3889 domain-containing protein n=1 Tax=Neobacillus mesonae TaxID=1193713 RepID=UPI002040E79A|nr:DUF3889 domain-containing protein [Neobacillus mesonae]MCM3570866.1 YqzG/YhdC family protein [Neobacillus mesonae]